MLMKKLFSCFVFSMICLLPVAQDKFAYKAPSDKLVQQKLKEWGDLKFGLMITWGALQPVGRSGKLEPLPRR